MFSRKRSTSKLATNIDIDVLDFKKTLRFIKYFNIDFVIVGPEEPLVEGLVDFLQKNDVKVLVQINFAKLEGSKSFMKIICAQNNIPTAKFKICTKKKQILNFLDNCNLPIVVKADGLGTGKGVQYVKQNNRSFLPALLYSMEI